MVGSGEARLVAVFADPGLTDRELDELPADTAHRWMHPTIPPEVWLDA
jgi:hypothetical protein